MSVGASTCEFTAVELQPHAYGAWVVAVGHHAQLPGHDGGSHFPQLRQVCVAVTLEDLQS